MKNAQDNRDKTQHQPWVIILYIKEDELKF